MQLYSFFNSSTSYRVRIALALKGLPYDYLPVNIRTGQHREPEYVGSINPSATVPALVDGSFALGQSFAIIDYLDALQPVPRLLPQDPVQRARVLELATLIGCDIHPVNNLRVLRYLQDVLKVTPEQKDAWYRHWIDEGMAGVERLLAQHGHGR
ncbi:glutathione S-transferase N-terminal domain-containing protein [Cupriavidus necator]